MQRIPPFKTLDVFRGFAAIWVVMVHSCDRWLPDGHMEYLKVPLYAFSMRGQLGVVLFFLISGYCITAAAYAALVHGKSVWRYAYERVRRIYPPYIVTMIVTLLSFALVYYISTHHIAEVRHLPAISSGPKYWLANVFLVQMELDTPMVNVVFWSLCYEVAFYLVVGIFLAISKWIAAQRDLHAGTVFLVCATSGSTVLSLGTLLILGTAPFPFDLWHQFSIGGLLFFLLEFKQANVSNYTQRFKRLVQWNIGIVAVFTIAFIVLRVSNEVDIGHPNSRIRSTVCLLFGLLLMGLKRFDERIASNRLVRPLVWAGAFSYSLYLTHPIILPFVDIVCRKAGLNGDRYWIAFWIQVAVAIAFGRFFYLLIEKHFISKRQVQRLSEEHVV